ncbi:S-adenosyl-L-methionine-dependent methyltransferase [Basidiobolus meristosporus CBS 931.73]|uniref:S-adenosyl-L-methionine-dependent methyltransferase n=1 Tax=Basidiobolus meristosporus CBS 931.73 TaxID=1314790 RepID=A0A1Y1X6B4_9FUNG|nr:S-adenosyl-L-methionine-dependent methyltransferase [Basidiobolus meristosporus CBS 931.73]|eukprot:ORX81341.1 S-adenosyl-L-methionine-dependent methyltransferase [Basidiobolus meristosporus CBS 931.73]
MEHMDLDYNLYSKAQATAGRQACQLIGEHFTDVTEARGDLSIADYGCSGGANSIPILNAVLSKVRCSGDITLCMVDLPDNDFTITTKTIQTAIEKGELVHRVGDGNLKVVTVGKSFYHQVLPTMSVDFGYSLVSVNCMEVIPCPIPGSLCHTDLPEGPDRKSWETIAENSWNTFLRHRQNELKIGGQMHVSGNAYLEKDEFTWCNIMRNAYTVFEAMFNEGKITREELDKLIVPTTFRSREEILKPFKENSDIHLKVESLSFNKPPCLYYEEYLRTKDSEKYATNVSNSFKNVFNNSFIKLLASNSGRILDEFWLRFHAFVAEQPEKIDMGLLQFHLILRK